MPYIDYIGYRCYDPQNGWSDETIVLSPSASGVWDDKHNCDPSVIKGTFEYNDTNYSYLMAYLGCTEAISTISVLQLQTHPQVLG